jgi:adhesin transport system membrane fusion protein
LDFPEDLLKAAPEIASSELRLFQVRKTNFDNQSAILSERLQQRRSELNELKANLDRFTQNLTIAKRELDIKLPLAARKVVPETDVLRLQREISDLTGQVNSATLATPRLEAAIQEAERQLEDHRLNFRQTAQQELNQRLAELGIVDQSFKGAKDRVVRTDIRSPVDGIVNRINFTTVGGVVRPGEVIAEIVPLEDALLIEVKIKPSDIAFVHVGQPAIVRLTAYDFSIYGSLHGTVVNVSPDSITDQNTKETYYAIMVQTKESALRRGGEFLPILPGMIASVDVITGAKSVLQYILKPIVKAKESALRER